MSQRVNGKKDREAEATLRALRRAARRARELGIETGTPVYVMKNNRIVDINAPEIRPARSTSRKRRADDVVEIAVNVRRRMPRVREDGDAQWHASEVDDVAATLALPEVRRPDPRQVLRLVSHAGNPSERLTILGDHEMPRLKVASGRSPAPRFKDGQHQVVGHRTLEPLATTSALDQKPQDRVRGHQPLEALGHRVERRLGFHCHLFPLRTSLTLILSRGPGYHPLYRG